VLFAVRLLAAAAAAQAATAIAAGFAAIANNGSSVLGVCESGTWCLFNALCFLQFAFLHTLATQQRHADHGRAETAGARSHAKRNN
jgi:hypothetical protein